MEPKTDVFFLSFPIHPTQVGMESNTEHGAPTEADIDVIADLPAEHAEVCWSQKIGQAIHQFVYHQFYPLSPKPHALQIAQQVIGEGQGLVW